MGRTTKAQQNRRNNLSKSKYHQKPSAEDIPEDENGNSNDEDLLEHGFFFLDDAPDGLDSEDDGSKNDAEIDHFNAILFEAQAMAVKAEREEKRRELAATNQKFISNWFMKKENEAATTIEVDSESEGEEEDEVEITMHRLFPSF
ncbi:hypothetical protein BDZ97DRAFT_1798750 [Flammula alnicola]|nr:hypothetical protein BDZ97DRAFT_1798750 [Flammula alnicola]